MTDALWTLSATRLAELILTREVSSREVVTAHLERIAAVNDKVNAVTVVLAESALAAADLADSTSPSGPLHGVPFSVKENIDCMGSATTNGIPMLAQAMPSMDAPVVERMKAAGGIPIARTNLPELGLRVSTDNPLRGRTLNPWHADRTAGGSSGGEGSAISTGMSPLGLGNDIGGSVRNPAYCCGITSLKPSVGRIPHAGSIPPTENGLAGQLMAVEGPLARHVGDLQLAYQVLSGRDARDPVSVDVPLIGPAPTNRRVALVTNVPGVTLPAQHVAAIRQAGQALAADGWEVSEVEPPELNRVNEIWGHILASEFEPQLAVFAQLMSAPAHGLLQSICETYPPSAISIPDIHKERWRLCCAWSAFFETYPIIIGPTWTSDPFLHDADVGASGSTLTIDTLRFITPANLMGLPAVSVPTGVHNGLPTGVQVVADRWRDDLALDAARCIESAVGQITPIDPVF